MGNFAGFQSVQLKKPLRSAFDLGHFKRLSMRMGQLVPILCQECIPSDSFRGSSEILLRLAPLLAPIYDQIQLFVHFFFVPNRLLWEDWEEFITGGRLGVGVDPVTAPVPPFFDIGRVMDEFAVGLQNRSLADYLGIPDFSAVAPLSASWDDHTCDLMPFLAYHIIWDQYYRDRNFIQDELTGEMPVASGEYPGLGFFALQKRNYLHDYFTSALAFTQRGEQVLIPVDAAVTYLDSSRIFYDDGSVPLTGENLSTVDTPVGGPTELGIGNGPVLPGRVENIESISNTTTTINDFRAAYALQVWLERNAIGGSRYTESTQAHFGVKPQDSRLQRPEYIGGGRISVKISEVVAGNWSNDGDADVPASNLSGYGVTYGNTNRFNYFCTEHGFIMGVASIMNPPSYQQGLPRMFRRRSFLDYPWPTFAKLGEQPVYDYEIYTDPASLSPLDAEPSIFGYQSRYADWKYQCTTNHGDFRTSLLFWTLTRLFDDPPVLGSTFNEFQDDTQDRIFAVGGSSVDNFWLYVNNSISVKRALPYFGTPNNLGFE